MTVDIWKNEHRHLSPTYEMGTIVYGLEYRSIANVIAAGVDPTGKHAQEDPYAAHNSFKHLTKKRDFDREDAIEAVALAVLQQHGLDKDYCLLPNLEKGFWLALTGNEKIVIDSYVCDTLFCVCRCNHTHSLGFGENILGSLYERARSAYMERLDSSDLRGVQCDWCLKHKKHGHENAVYALFASNGTTIYRRIACSKHVSCSHNELQRLARCHVYETFIRMEPPPRTPKTSGANAGVWEGGYTNVTYTSNWKVVKNTWSIAMMVDDKLEETEIK